MLCSTLIAFLWLKVFQASSASSLIAMTGGKLGLLSLLIESM